MSSFFIIPKTFQLILVSSLLFIIKAPCNAQLVFQACRAEGNYTANSSYETSLNQLLVTLSSSESSPLDYNQKVVGTPPDRAYGYALCRGDVSPEACQKCVQIASQEVVELCPFSRGAYIWYDNCLLRYSNQTFFSTLDMSPYQYLGLNVLNASDPERFNRSLLDLLYNISTIAANSMRLFATGETNYSSSSSSGSRGSETVYGLVQCTRDITQIDCRRCLEVGINDIPSSPISGRLGGRVIAVNCYFRFENYPFYNSTAATSPVPPTSTTPIGRGSNRNSARTIVAVVVLRVIAAVLISLLWICLQRKRARTESIDYVEMSIVLHLEFGTIATATGNFCTAKKLGEGGFGPVYKGTLDNGQEIAVKRLSKNSEQGAEEFKNEVKLVAKLQHRNLVRLLGYCLEGEEKILIYEYIPNTSLDKFLFDPAKQTTLTWDTRYKIIGGIARGLLYLHEDSRLRIVHRDLKASNILLDDEMTPKISDFGTARLFRVDQNQGHTNRIVGTYGYMSPEYAMHGQFSVKSDVYSFGVLLLEIVSGQKNSNIYQSNRDSDLPSYAWKQWIEGRALKLIDPAMIEQCPQMEVMRCTHIGLLCVQEDLDLRPIMSSVVHMLSSDSVALPSPSTPGYFVKSMTKAHQSIVEPISCSVNEMSVTEFVPR